jgi:hypothetical protein
MSYSKVVLHKFSDHAALAAVAGGSSPPAVCSAGPGSVPLVMDTIPPATVSVQTELDPTANPSGVALQGVTVP